MRALLWVSSLAASSLLCAVAARSTEMAHLLIVSEGPSRLDPGFDGTLRAKGLVEPDLYAPPVRAPGGGPPKLSELGKGDRLYYGIFAVQMVSSLVGLGLGFGGAAGALALGAGALLVAGLLGYWLLHGRR